VAYRAKRERENKSASKIQSLFKMFVTRKVFLQILEDYRKMNKQKQQELDGVTSESSQEEEEQIGQEVRQINGLAQESYYAEL